MRTRSLLLLAVFASLCTGIPACDTGCPSGQNRVCDEDGRDCECLDACESHADCESGRYCVESINSCDHLREGQLGNLCGHDQEGCCVMTNVHGTTNACAEGLPCNEAVMCGELPPWYGCLGLEQTCTVNEDCCSFFDGSGACVTLPGAVVERGCRLFCDSTTDCPAEWCCAQAEPRNVCQPIYMNGEGAGAPSCL